MIIDILDNYYRYTKLHKFFKPAFGFLRKENLNEYKEGRYDIIKNDVYALISRASGRGKGSCLEVHRKYIDIQMPLIGQDLIGCRMLCECRYKKTSYNAEKDCAFFRDKSNFWFKLSRGSFAIFFPEDAHAPLCGKSEVLKAVVKVRV